MSVRVIIEAAAFVGVAVALHLIWFANQTEGSASAGGSGGESSVSLAGASGAMASLVENWDAGPEETPAADLAKPAALLAAPKLERATMQKPPSPIDVDDARPAIALPKAPTIESVVEIRAAEVASKAPKLREAISETGSVTIAAPSPPETPEALSTPVSIPKPSLGERPPTPAADTNPQPLAPSQQNAEEAVEADELASLAPENAPRPAAKPTRTRAQLAKEPTAERRKTLSPAPAATTEAQRPGSDAQKTPGDTATTASIAAGAGGTSEAGSGLAAASTSGGAKRASLAQAWGREIRRKVERKKPRNTRRSGKVEVSLTVGRAGELIDAAVKTSSGVNRLDQAALVAVRAAAPYSAAPDELRGGTFVFLLPVVFKR